MVAAPRRVQPAGRHRPKRVPPPLRPGRGDGIPGSENPQFRAQAWGARAGDLSAPLRLLARARMGYKSLIGRTSGRRDPHRGLPGGRPEEGHGDVHMSQTAGPEPVKRGELTVAQLAGMLEHRLHWDHLNEDEFVAGCHYAADAGLAAVLCRPEQVPLASRALADATPRIVTALGYHDRDAPSRSLNTLTSEALELADQGADELCLIGAPGRVLTGLLMEQLDAVREAVDPLGVAVRAVLDCKDVPMAEVSATSARVGTAGVATVECGAIHGEPPSFACVEAMKDALPDSVLLKWTQELKSLEALLVCVSMGLDRFNADPKKLLRAAKRSAEVGPLTVPAHGLDY